MPYKPTGNPPGRPKKQQAIAEPSKPLTRARASFRRLAENPVDVLHRPPRNNNREAKRRPILHPNVIAG